MIYLDNAATTWPKPESVICEMQRFLAEDSANPGRGSHQMALRCGRMIEDVRRKLTTLINGDNANRLILCLNCTDALNLGIKGVISEGDHVITTVLEHNSVSRPLQAMADKSLVELTRVGCTRDGFIDPDEIEKAWRPNTKLVVCTHGSNVLGTIQPAAEIGKIVRERDGVFLLDAAQTLGIVPVDVAAMNVDLLAFPGHKELFGPTGTGGLYVAPRVTIRPWREGGTGGDSSSPTQPEEYPYFLEAGTPNSVGIAGLNAGLDFVSGHANGELLARARELIGRLISALQDDARFQVHGPGDVDRIVGVAAVTVTGMEPEDVGAILDESFDIAVRPGLQCAPYTHQAMGTSPGGTVRLSVSSFNAAEDIEQTIRALKEIASSV